MQLAKTGLHIWTLVLRKQDVMVRENLGIQTNINAAFMEIAKSYNLLAATQSKDAKDTLKEVKQVVEQGVVAAAKVVADSGTQKTPARPGEGGEK